jgi:lipoate-protein ligase A
MNDSGPSLGEPVTHRGECKTPGGKLVAVELAVSAGLLQAVRLSGDFFFHPPGAERATLTAIAAGLEGAPADSSTAGLAARIRAAIPFGVDLLGTSPEAIAVAVRRAVTGDGDLGEPPPLDRVGSFTTADIDRLTRPWQDLPWRIIPEEPRSPALNVALDEVLTDRVAAGLRPPTLRFWRWTDPAVIIGRCQSVLNEVDRDAAAVMGVQIVRRMTGGGAMFLQPHGAITYSLYLPESALAGLTIRQSYEVCDAWVIRALRELGVDAHHVPINDIACSGGKIGGAAQARRRGVVLHHTTIAHDMDPGEMVRVLRIGREKLKDKAVVSASKRVSPLVRQTGLPREAIVEHLHDWFRRHFGGQSDAVTGDELYAGGRLVTEKYGHAVWTEEFE